MQAIDGSEAWRQIPPEEKVEIMNRAHSTGFFAAVITVLIGCTLAMALNSTVFMWGAIIGCPIVFQFAAGKAWRDLRPRVMLEYLAARSVARRFAFATGAKDLRLSLIFRGKAEEVIARGDIQEALEATMFNNSQSEVWIALFQDALVLMTERPGGARLTLGQLLNEKVEIQSSDQGGYTNSKVLNITVKDRSGPERTFRVSSKYPGALVVFEKKALEFKEENKKLLERQVKALTSSVTEGEDDEFPTSTF